MKRAYAFILLVLCCSSSYAEELVAIKILDGKMSLLVPQDFTAMSPEMLEVKYPGSRRPTEVLSNQDASVSLAFNHTQSPMAPEQVSVAHKSISKAFHSQHPSATWIRDEVITLNGQDYLVLELVTSAVDTNIHNIIYGTSVDNRFLLVAFNATVDEAEKWVPIGKKMLESLTINSM